MPQVVRVQIRQPNHRTFRLWIPVLPVLIVVSPLFVLATVPAVIACLVWRVDPIRALVATGRLLCAVKGTTVEVDQPGACVLIDIR